MMNNTPSVVQNYSHLMIFFHDLASEEQNNSEVEASGFARTLSKFDTHMIIKLLTLKNSLLEIVRAALQKTALKFDQAEHFFKALRQSLSELRKQRASFLFTKHKQRFVNCT